jgi:hypothetical protein
LTKKREAYITSGEMADVEENDVTMAGEDDYDEKLKFLNPIATPLANKKLVKSSLNRRRKEL